MLEQQLTSMKEDLSKLATKLGVSFDDILQTMKGTASCGDPLKKIAVNVQERKFPDGNFIKSASMNHFKGKVTPQAMNVQQKSLFKQKTSMDMEIDQGQHGILLSSNLKHIETSLTDMNNLSDLILKDIVELMATGKTFKIRQNFRGMALQMLNLEELTFYVCHDSGRIEYQDFLENFITEIMQNDPKCCALEKIFGSANEDYHFVDLTDNSDLMKIFEINNTKIERGRYFGVTMNCAGGEQQQSFSVCMMIKTKELIEQISEISERHPPKLLRKIIEISLISTSEDSKFMISKAYAVKMLDLLEILIIKTEAKLKRNLSKKNNLCYKAFYSVTNVVKIILSKFEENIVNQSIIHKIRTMSSQFQEEQYRMVEQIRMYKKYVREMGVIFLEFSQAGALNFLSGNKQIPILVLLNQVWEPRKPILNELFGQNQKLYSHIKRTIRGCSKSERTFEIDTDIKARICMDNGKIEKIHIIIEDRDESNLSDSVKEDSTIKTKKKEKKEAQSMTNSSVMTIKQLQKQNPGISQEGWLELFLKRNMKKQFQDANEQKKANSSMKTFNNVELVEHVSDGRSRTNTFSHSYTKEFNFGMENIDIRDPAMNVLTLADNELEDFALIVFAQLSYFECFHKEKVKLQNFIEDLHDNYEIHSNPFHNFQHGVNVMHSCFLLSTMSSNFNILNEKDIFAIVFSGLCHDVGHTGFTNTFQIASQSKKALMYNDKSPLENYHASLTFEILRKESNNFLSSMSRDDFCKFRQAVIENILFTDIKEHFPILHRFNEILNKEKTLGRDHCNLISNIIVHSSDFAGSIKPFEICKEWSLRVNQEFANQYKTEGELGLPQTPFMKDLQNPAVLSKAEGGFLKVIVYPLYQALDKMYLTEGMVHKFKKNIEQNIREWEQIHKSEIEKEKENTLCNI